jgi:hypothetical protein
MASDLPHAAFAAAPAPEITLLRIGLIGAGGILLHIATTVAASGLLVKSPENVFWLILSGGLAMVALAAAGLRQPAASLRWLILAAVIGEVLIKAVIWAQTTDYTAYVQIDSALYLEMAGELVQAGENPYDWDLAGVYNIYRRPVRQHANPQRRDSGQFPISGLGRLADYSVPVV